MALLAVTGSALAGPVVRFGVNGTTQVNGEFRAISLSEGTEALLRLDGSLIIPPGIHGAQLIGPGPFAAVSCSLNDNDHEWIVAISADGTLQGSGYNFFGTLNLPLGQFVEVSAGGMHGVARRADGTLAGWGDLGPGTPPPGSYTAIAAGRGRFALALRPDQTIAYWGSQTLTVATPQAGTFRAIRAAEAHALAIRTDGTLLAWGSDVNGTGILNTPPGTYKVATPGDYFSAAIREDGTIVVWGLTSDLGPPPTPPPGVFRDVGVAPWQGLALSEACYPNCDASSIPPVLNVQDFACFLNRFASASSLRQLRQQHGSPRR
jgi:hypothetical protein